MNGNRHTVYFASCPQLSDEFYLPVLNTDQSIRQ